MAIAIFVLLGIRLIIKALKNDIINEKLEEKMEIKKYILPLVVIGGYTITTGIAAGFVIRSFDLGILVVDCQMGCFICMECIQDTEQDLNKKQRLI